MRKSKLKTIVIIISIILIFTLIGLTNKNERKVTIIEKLISSITTMPQRTYEHIRRSIVKDQKFFEDIEMLKRENEKLEEENEKLKEIMSDYEIIKASNNILKEQAQLESAYPDYKTVPASIIESSMSNWEEVYIIDKGEKDGIQENMPVITLEGLVGYVESVTNSTAKVISILDAGNAISARIARTRDLVISKGNLSLKEKGQMKISSIPIGIELVEGDKVETSGMGGTYPKGIGIGEVISFKNKKNPTQNEAIIQSYVDFGKLETVAVIIEE